MAHPLLATSNAQKDEESGSGRGGNRERETEEQRDGETERHAVSAAIMSCISCGEAAPATGNAVADVGANSIETDRPVRREPSVRSTDDRLLPRQSV